VKRIAVAIALVWRDRRLLVTKRAQAAHLAGFWEFPGGKLAEGETPEACAVREVLEETRVSIVPRSRRELIVWEYPDRAVTLQPVVCDWRAGDGECVQVAELAWCLPAELASLSFPPANAALVASLIAEAEASASGGG
jgi:8-oxo-dGTP diphosphatase